MRTYRCTNCDGEGHNYTACPKFEALDAAHKEWLTTLADSMARVTMALIQHHECVECMKALVALLDAMQPEPPESSHSQHGRGR